MFKQAKSAVFWYYLIKFRRKVAFSFTLIFLSIISEFIYSDLVQYLKLREKVELLDYILPAKWIFITLCIFFAVSLILSIFKNSDKESKEVPKEEKRESKHKFTSREEKFLYKKKLDSKAEKLLKK